MHPQSKPWDRSKPIVLTVEDDPGVREALHLILDDEYEVVEAPDSRAALAACRARRPDVILLDILLPGTDGIEVLRDLRRLDTMAQIIMVTAVKTVTTAVAAMRLGAVDYLTKPFGDEELIWAVRRAMEHRSRAAPGRPGGERRAVVPLSRHVQRAVDYLSTHYADPVTIATVASAVGLSAGHLAHLFRAETGMTIRRYLLKTRVDVAKERLESGKEKLAGLARQVGFCDASHLTRSVLRLTGRRPSSFRSTTRQGP